MLQAKRHINLQRGPVTAEDSAILRFYLEKRTLDSLTARRNTLLAHPPTSKADDAEFHLIREILHERNRRARAREASKDTAGCFCC